MELPEEFLPFSTQAVQLAVAQLEETSALEAFGGVLTTEMTFQLVVYTDPGKTNIDPREHATTIQKLLMEYYKKQDCFLIFMAWGAKVALESGSGKTIEVDCIHVRVGNRLSGIHKILVYPYRIIEGKVDLMDIMKPIAKEV